MHLKLTRVLKYCSIIFACCLLVSVQPLLAQFTDNFEDGNFTADPEWTGDTDNFQIEGEMLRLVAPAEVDQSYLVTPSESINDATWEFWVRMDFNPSGANFSDIYLVSNQSNLKQPLNGYFVRVGNTADEVSLYVQQGATQTEIINGPDGFVNMNQVLVRVRASRDALGNWTLEADNTGGNDFQLMGNVLDDTFIQSYYFGVVCTYTATRSDLFYFDDFNVSGDPFVDEIPPVIESLEVLSATELQLLFSEPLDETSAEDVNNYDLQPFFGQPVTAMLNPENSVEITLQFANEMQNGNSYNLLVSGVEDLSGNPMAPDAIQFLFVIPEEAEFKDIIINEIMADPNPPVNELPNQEYLEIFNVSDKYIDLEDWGLSVSTANFPAYIIEPGEFLILCQFGTSALFESYGNVLEMISSSTALTNGGTQVVLTNAEGSIIDDVTYSDSWYNDPNKEDGGWSLELINPETECSGAQNWTASNSPTGGTPGSQNSVFDTAPDTDGPALTGFSINNPQNILLFFSEALDVESMSAAQIEIVPELPITDFSLSADFLVIDLQLGAPIDTGVTYLLTVTGVTDCPGNLIADENSIEFVIGYQPGLYDVLINEIMADPTPAVGLPPHEYIELYNPTDRLLDLSGCRISTATFRPNTFIAPGEHLVLISPSNEGLFAGIEPLAVMQSMSTTFLTNGGRELYFANANDELIDVVEYSIDWYQSDIKSDGGWSLERINPQEPCRARSNWIASVNSSGGTPGNQNSVYDTTPDNTPPALVNFTIVGVQSVTVFFNERMDTTTVAIENISISPEIPISGFSVSEDALALNLFLSEPIDTAVYYTATITDVADCVGNIIGDENNITFVIGYTPGLFDVLINEIMANPTPAIGLPPHEYIELYNPTDRLYDLSNCNISSSVTFRPNTFIAPGQFLVLISPSVADEFQGVESVAVLQSMSTTFLTNAGRELFFANGSNQKIDRVNYSDTWYRDASKTSGGWSLERINPDEPCRGGDNWRAPVNANGGTPGMQNSIFDLSPDETAPRLNSILVLDEFTVELVFNEVLDSLSVLNATFEITPALTVLQAQNVAHDYLRVRLTFAEEMEPNQKHEVFITGLSDCMGNGFENLDESYFGLPTEPTSGGMIINEILFNARTGGANFLEIYNNSDAILSIRDWQIANLGNNQFRMITDEGYILFPEEYLAITTNKANIVEEYPVAVEKRIFQTAQMPSFNNSDGQVVLIDTNGETVDRFDYDKDMHFPLLRDVKGVSLERIDFNRPSDDRTNWMSAAENVNWGTPGFENSQFMQSVEADGEVWLDPEIFSPDNDGYQDVLNINYRFDRSGMVGNIKIFDSSGRLVRRLMQNELLGTEGVISWDGIGDNLERARIGIHVIYMEVFSSDGYTKGFKLSCVVASRY